LLADQFVGFCCETVNAAFGFFFSLKKHFFLAGGKFDYYTLGIKYALNKWFLSWAFGPYLFLINIFFQL